MGHALEFFGLGLPGRPDAALAPSWQAFTPETLPPGYVLGDRFEIAELLGTRAHTQIYRGHDARTGRAVKIRRHDDAEADAAAWREHALLGRLRHAAVPRAIAAFQDGGRACFVQGYMEGPTLREAFKREGTFDDERAGAVLASALEALVHLHSRRPPVLHRDLKPANMVLGDGDRIGLIDFGIARLGIRRKQGVPLDELTDAYTVGYAPPEQVNGLEAFPQTDLYALAASIVYVATDVHPVHHWDAHTGRLEVPQELGGRLAGILRWMLEPGLAARCPSARAALQRLG